jgi:vacuolar iron transporter family protein
MRHSIKVGLSFGLTSGVITTLGLMVGLYAGTGSERAVIAGIMTIALADAMSDSLGIHVAEESEGIHTNTEVWVSTLTTFFAKLSVSLTFLVPALLLPLGTAVVASCIWGGLLLAIYSFIIAQRQKANVAYVVVEHLLIAILVVLASYGVGQWVDHSFL